ncbi:MAG: SMC-Scp complex subunit ScpB [Ginsengibacter sp.]
MELSIIIPHIEALIFASDKPLSIADMVELLNTALGFIDDMATAEQVEAAVNAIAEKYDSEFYAFEIVESGGGWQFLTKKEYHKTVAQLNGDKFLKKLSVAAIETLSIIAYKQPVTKSEIELIRGVNCDYAVQKLLEKDLVVIAGRKEDAPGKPLIYTTSKSFMDYFGINSPQDLPKIKEVLDQEVIEATQVEQQSEEEISEPKLIVENERLESHENSEGATEVIEHIEIIEDHIDFELSNENHPEENLQVDDNISPSLTDDNSANTEDTQQEP